MSCKAGATAELIFINCPSTSHLAGPAWWGGTAGCRSVPVWSVPVWSKSTCKVLHQPAGWRVWSGLVFLSIEPLLSELLCNYPPVHRPHRPPLRSGDNHQVFQTSPCFLRPKKLQSPLTDMRHLTCLAHHHDPPWNAKMWDFRLMAKTEGCVSPIYCIITWYEDNPVLMCLVSCSFFYYLSQDWVDIIEYKKIVIKIQQRNFSFVPIIGSSDWLTVWPWSKFWRQQYCSWRWIFGSSGKPQLKTKYSSNNYLLVTGNSQTNYR